MYAQTPFPESAKSSRSPKIAKAQQTDIRTYFSPSPKNTPRTSPTNTPNPPPKTIMPPAARPKNHDSLFSEWKAPTYRPSSHKRSATADATLPSLTYNCNKALPNPRITSVIDASLLPPPLRLPTPSTSTCAKKEWKPRHRHQPSTTSIAEEGEGCVLMAAIDTRGAFRKSRVMALFDEQNLGIESALADPCGTASRESDEGEETVIYFRPEITPASPTNSKAESRPVVVEASQEENLSAKQTVNNVPKGHTRHSHKASKLLGGEEDTGQYLFPPFGTYTHLLQSRISATADPGYRT